nr:repressor of filamentous growth 1 [Quercus suber]
MNTVSQDEQDFVGHFEDTGHLQQQIDHSTLQTWTQDYTDFRQPLATHGILIDNPGVTVSDSSRDLVFSEQTFFQPIPEALQRVGVVSIGHHDATTLPTGYPIWYHPRIGHFSPVQHDPEFGYYVPISLPAPFQYGSLSASADINPEPIPQHEQRLLQTWHVKKRIPPTPHGAQPSKRARLVDSKAMPRHIHKPRDDQTIRQDSPELKVKKLRSNVVKSCVCQSARAYVPRPSNAFVLYKSQHSRSFTELAHAARSKGDSTNSTPAKQASNAWNAESEETKDKFRTLAKREKAEHAQKYPYYRYEPNKKQANRFGDHTCKCGAYQINCAALKTKDHHDFRRSFATSIPSPDHESDQHQLHIAASPLASQHGMLSVVHSTGNIDPFLLDLASDGNWTTPTSDISHYGITPTSDKWTSDQRIRHQQLNN